MSIRIIQGDVREELPKLPADYFDCIVTSPPYFGLRDYGCDGQIGLEPTLDEYLETMVAVCRDLRRVLKPSGVFFLNIGDSYSSAWACSRRNVIGNGSLEHGKRSDRPNRLTDTLKEKDLMLVPERLGIALQADGWWVRSHIIWHKLNPMPESVTDRPTSAHETIWLLTKSARYFWDGEAINETSINAGRSFPMSDKSLSKGQSKGICIPPTGNALKDSYSVKETRNIRNVWSVASHSFSGAHFATMPPEIAERCIKAGSSERGCCPECGAPWVRLMSKREGEPPDNTTELQASRIHKKLGCQYTKFMNDNPIKTVGWQQSCKHYDILDPIHARILDPFAGAGTTGLVADRLGRDATLIDLNTSYIDMAVNRIRDDAPLFAKVAAE